MTAPVLNGTERVHEDGEVLVRIDGFEHEGSDRVQTLRLDSAVAATGLERLDFLKIDVGGHETPGGAIKEREKQQRGQGMKQDISEMAPAGAESEKLDIQHM
jgi:hypothetical protein